MKRFIVAIALAICASYAHGQGIGTFEFMNVGVTPDRQIYLGEYLTGPKAEGSGYRIAIFWGPSGTTDENLMIQLTPHTDLLLQGQFSGGARTIFDLSEPGGVVALQARAWDVSTGATWAEAAANPAGLTGKGPIFEIKTKDPADFLEPLPRTGYAAGWVGFAIAVPEPSTWALATIGAIGLLFLRRRR